MVPVAIAQMVSARGLAVVIGLGAMAALGRILTPSDFGTFAFAMAVFGVIKAVSEFGLIHFIVRQDEYSLDEVRSAAGLALTLALGLSTITCAAVILVGGGSTGSRFALAAFLAGALVAGAVAMPHEARRQRDIDFGLLSGLAVVQAGADAGAAVALALFGFGPSALAAGVFVSQATGAVVLTLTCPTGERPWPRLGGWRRFGGFGTRFVAARLLPRLGEFAIVAMLARALGVRSLGLYNRAGTVYGILDRTLFDAINPVILPAISKVLRGHKSAGRVYLDKVDYLVAVCWPAFGLIALLAEPLVQVLLGSQWSGAVAPVQILALGGLAVPLTKMSMKLFVAANRLDVHLRIQAITVGATVAGAGLGSLHSLAGACAGLALARVVEAILVWRGVGRVSHDALGVPTAAIARGLTIGAASLIGPLVLTIGFDLADWALLAASGVLGGAGWLTAVFVTRHRLADDLRGLVPATPERQSI